MPKNRWQGLLLAAASIWLAACGAHAPASKKSPPNKTVVCQQWFKTLNQRVTHYDVQDTQAAVIPGFPALRVNRFYQSVAQQSLSPAQFNQWLDGLQRLGEQAWRVQLQNLPSAEQQNLQNQIPPILTEKSLNNSVKICSRILRPAEKSQQAI